MNNVKETFGKAGYIAIDTANIWTRNRKYTLHDDSGFIQFIFNTDNAYLIIEEWRKEVKEIQQCIRFYAERLHQTTQLYVKELEKAN